MDEFIEDVARAIRKHPFCALVFLVGQAVLHAMIKQWFFK